MKFIYTIIGIILWDISFLNASSHPDALSLKAKQVLLIDLNTQTVLYEKNADQRIHPSSMTKIMQAYLVFDDLKNGHIHLTDTLPVSIKAWKMQGTRTFLPVNTLVPIEDLLKGLIIQSGNDASIVLAEGLAGTEETCAKKMTQIAHALGARNTHFINTTGLAHPRHYSTARDLAQISQKLIGDFPEFYYLFSGKEFTFNNIKQANRNPLLGIPGLGCDGIKTGHTDAGGYGMVASAMQEGRRLLLVLNGTPSEKERQKIGESLLRWGFKNFEDTLVLKAHTPLLRAKISMGNQSRIDLGAIRDTYASLPLKCKRNFSVKTFPTKPLTAPMKTGDIVGTVEIHCNGMNPLTFPLASLENIEKANLLRRIWLTLYYAISETHGKKS